MKPLTSRQIEQLLKLVKKAGEQIMAIYHDDFNIDFKADKSPVTQADLMSSKVLETGLPTILPLPVLSEESVPQTPEWLDWETFWLIDPIDGTKHFINQTGEFCICIALIHQHRPVLGLIYAPTAKTAWFSQYGSTPVKYYEDTAQTILPKPPSQPTAAISAKNLSANMMQLIDVLPECQHYSRGSALKYVDILEGKATIYPKMWDTCEWDSAAGQCLLESAGGAVIRFDNGKPLSYGSKTSLINPHFLAYHYLPQQTVEQLLARYQIIHQ